VIANGGGFYATHGGIELLNGTMAFASGAGFNISNGGFFSVGGNSNISAVVTADNSHFNGPTGIVGANGSVSLTNNATWTMTDGTGVGSFSVGGGTAITPASVTLDHSTLSVGALNSFNWQASIGAGGYGVVTVQNGGSFSAGPGGTVGASIGSSGGNGTLLATGTSSKASFIYDVRVGTDANNNAGTGLFQLDHNAAGTTSGNLIIASGGTLKVLSGAILNAFEIDLSSAGAYDFTGGIVNLTGGAITVANLSIPSTATLQGQGAVTGNVNNSGIVSPGDAPGILTVNGNFIQASAGTLEIGLGGTSPGTQYDQLKTLGSASFAGTLDVVALNTFAPARGQSFDLFTFGSDSGTFANVILPQPAGGGTWDTSALYTSGVITVVPEPMAVSVLALAGLSVLCRRRRRKLTGNS
jgi:hypothetical protein